MAKATKKKTTTSLEDFVPMKRTRAMLNEVWDRWTNSLGHTPDTAKRMMTAAIDEMHKAETNAAKKISAKKTAIKKAVTKKVSAKKAVLKKKLK